MTIATNPAADAVAPVLPASAPAGQPVVTAGTPSMVSLPTKAFRELKQDAKEKGKTEALAAMDTRAQAMGFANAEALFAAQAAQRANPGTPAQPPTQAGQPPQTVPAASQPPGMPAAPYAPASQQPNELEVRLAAMERELATAKTESWLRASGVQEVDLAQMLLNQDVNAPNFDGNVWLTNLRAAKPFLFAQAQAPASAPAAGAAGGPAPVNGLFTAGPGGAQAPAAPAQPPANSGVPGNASVPPAAPANVVGAAAQPPAFNALTATPEQVQARLKQLGLNSGGGGFRSLPQGGGK